jgi:hypothetical protein
MQSTFMLLKYTRNTLLKNFTTVGDTVKISSPYNNNKRSMSVKLSYKLKKDAKQYSSDNNKNHTTECIEKDCEKKNL